MGRKLLFSLAEAPQKFTTPCILVGTRNGTVPHLTKETWDILEKGLPNASCQTPAFLMPFNTWVSYRETLKNYGKGLASFMGHPEKSVIITTQDPTEPIKMGYSQNASVSLWNFSNRLKVDPEIYVDGIEAAKANGCVSLCDGETPKDSSNKRISKSVAKSLDFLDVSLRKINERSLQGKISTFGAIEGGYDLKARKFSTKQTAERPVDGFLLDGFHENGKQSGDVDITEVKSILHDILPSLPEDKPRLYFGSCDPHLMLSLIEAGIDVFESSYAYHMTQEGRALTFKNSLSQEVCPNEGINNENENLPVKTDKFTIDLKDKEFKEDFSPILKSCSCYTCRKHTKGYINHLLVTGEMLAPVLIMIHNLHHLLVFFDSIRKCIDDDNLIQLKMNLDK